MSKVTARTARWPQRDAKAMLQRHAELGSLSGPEWEAALADAMVVRSPPTHTPELEIGKGAAGHFGIVLEGTVRVSCLSEDGRTLGICRVRAGELCVPTLNAIYSREMVQIHPAAEGPVVMLQIPAIHLPILLAHCEPFRAYLMYSMSKHVSALVGRIEDTTFGSLESRIVSHLRDMQGMLSVSHQELAEELGSAREAVSRTLKQLERSGTVILGRRSISLVETSAQTPVPAPRAGAPGVMESRRLRQSFRPAQGAPQKRPDLRAPVARRETSRDFAERLRPGAVGAADLPDRRTVARSSPEAVAKRH